MSTDFDKYAEDYNDILKDQLNFFDEESNYFAEYKVHIVRNRIRSEPETILEYGCGTGRNIPFLHKMFPGSKVSGCDLSEKSLEIAKKMNTAADFFPLNNSGQFSKKFDLVLVACVFHHIPPPDRRETISELRGLLRPGGELFVFEHNPFNPVTRRLVNTCPFDKDAVLLRPKELRGLFIRGGLEILKMRYALFFPGFLKKIRFIEKGLGWLPMGGQYYLQALSR